MIDFWDSDSWFLFVRDRGLQLFGKNMTDQQMLDSLVDLFQKPYHYEEHFRTWEEERLNYDC